eukprot:TCALIF_02329-PA protein Name:"Similar to Fgd6 FYVE, RhoGEF and PH domain-containing protein 6 (Mus musculus)" AED:0.05 eAED:0.05 QI:118/0.55/0.5/1/1/0.9/10/547/2858
MMRNKRANNPNRLRNGSYSPSRSPRNSISCQTSSSPVSSPRNSMYKDTLVMNSLNNISNTSDSSPNSKPVVNARSVGVPKHEGENDTASNSQKKHMSKNKESGKLVAGSSSKGSVLKSSLGAPETEIELSSAKSGGRTRTKSSLLPQRNSLSSESHQTKPQKSVTISEPMYDHPKPVVAVVDPVNSPKNTLEEDFSPQASPTSPSNGSLSKSSSGQRSRIPTSPPSPTSNSGVNNSKPNQDREAPLTKSGNKPLASKKMMANINGTQVKLIQSPKNKSRHHHFSQLVSAGHLNKSTPNSLNTVGKVNIRGKASGTAKPTSKSRPVSREFDSFVGKVNSASSLGSVEAKNHLVNFNPRVKKTTEKVPSMGSLQQLAPKAKFRSDGEISICGTSDPLSHHVQAQTSPKGDLTGIEQENKNPSMPSESTGRESPEHVHEAAPNNLAAHMDTKTCNGEPTRQSSLSTPKRPPRTLSSGGVHSSKAIVANIPSSFNSRTSSSTSASATVSGTIPQCERGQNEHPPPPPPPPLTCTLDESSRTGKRIEKNGGKNSRGNNATPGSGARIPPTTTAYSSVEQNPRSSADVQCWPWALQQPTDESRTSSVHISESCLKSRKNADIDTNHSQVKGLRDSLKSDSACKNLERQPPSRKSRRRDNIKSKNNTNNTNTNIVKHDSHSTANGSANSKSATLDCDIERGGFFKARSRSLTFFQRLGGLRRSLSRSLGLNPTSSPSSSETQAPAQTKDPLALSKDVNHKTNQPLRANPSNEDRDWVFFRGFSGKRREDLIEPYAVCHGPVLAIQSSNPFPQAPPRRKRPRRQQLISKEQSRETSHLLRVVDTLNPLRRSLSFTDAHFIAQAVYEGDTKLIEELYPDFPLSTPIYAVIDKSKKNHTRKLSQRPTSEIHTVTPSLSVGVDSSHSKKAGAIAKTHNNDQTRQILSSRSSPGPRDPPSSQAHSPSSSEKHHHHHHRFVQDRKCHPLERNSLATAGQEGVATFISPTTTPVVDGREFEHSDRISGPSRRVIVSLSDSTNLIATPNNSSAQDNCYHHHHNSNNNNSINNVMKGIDVHRSTASTSSLTTTTTTTTSATTISSAHGFRRSPGPAFCRPGDQSDSLPVPQPFKKGASTSRYRKLSNSSANNEQFLLNNCHSNEQIAVSASPRLSHNTHYRQQQQQLQEQKVVKSRNHHNGSSRMDSGGDRVDDNNVTFSCPVMFVKQDDPRSPHLSVETSSSHFTSVDHQSDLGPPQTPPLPPLRMDLFDHEPSLVISPWNTHQHGRPGSTSSNESSSGCSSGNGNGHLQLIDPDEWHTTTGGSLPSHHQPIERSQPHPFAQRAHTHYSQRQNQRQNQLLSDERERFQPTLSNSDGVASRTPSGGRCMIGGSDMQQDVSITTSRRNGSGGVTLSPGTLTGSHELNINGDTRHNGHLIYNNVSHLKSHNRMDSPRYMRSESADRLLDNERLLRGQDKNQSKKNSAPAFGTAHPRDALASFHHISPRDHSIKVEDLSNGNSKFDLDDSFRHILAKADNSISQAESILSSLRVESHAEIPRLMDKVHGDLDDDEDHDNDDDDANHHNHDDDSDPEQPHLGSDIETNIRRLEKTQAKINAALKTFRTVQALSDNTNIIRSTFRPRGALGHHPPANFHPNANLHQSNLNNNESQSSSQVGLAFQSLPHRNDGLSRSHSLPQGDAADRSGKALTAPANMESAATAAAQVPLIGTNQSTTSKGSLHPIVEPNAQGGTPKGRKTSLFRRHSFSLIANKEKSPASECSSTLDSGSSRQGSSTLWYEGDLESDAGQKSSGHLYDESHSYSDSEGGFLPLRHRLRGLLGSFGKGKKKIPRSGSGKRRIRVEHIGSIEVKHAHDQNSPVLKAQLGEFTRQIESLSNGRDSPANAIGARQSIDTNPQDKEHHHQCQVISGGATASTKSIILRPKRELVKNDSVDTYASCESSFNGNSNRNSVISGQSVSSESFGQEDHSVSDDDRRGGDGHSSPQSHNDDLTPAQRHEKKVYYIAREIMTSERVFVDILRLLNVEFREFVQHARRESKSGIMPDTDFSRLFSNLPELQTLNEDLLQDFEDRVENWDTQKKIADVIVKKGPFLKLYTTYIREFSTVNYHFDECCQKYPKFGKLVKEFEARERCRNLKIKHFMLKPVQRLPQYRLLLEDYLKHLDPQSPDFDDTTNALHIVSEAADHANDTIKQGDKFRRMLKLQSRLGDLELIRPGRELIREGELQKISRKGIGPRYFVLLSDCLLYCTYSGSWTGDSTNLRVSYKIPLTALQVRVPNYDDYQNEFYITSPVRSCTLRSSTVHERNDWLDALNSAIEDHVSRKATFHAVNGLQDNFQFISPDEAGKIGNSAPVWIPDRRVTMCQNCAVEFSVLVRRHHCRACGKVICATCSANKAPLRYREFEAARVCDECFDFLERGAQMCGYLKRRMKNSKWKRMWFVLKDRVLYAYKASEDSVAADTFPILGYDLDTLSEKNFELYEGEYAGLVFILSHPGGESLVFCAENDNICEKWISALREASVSFPLALFPLFPFPLILVLLCGWVGRSLRSCHKAGPSFVESLAEMAQSAFPSSLGVSFRSGRWVELCGSVQIVLVPALAIHAAFWACLLWVLSQEVRGLGEITYAVNCGGEAHIDVFGIHYQKDQNRVGTASEYGKQLIIARVPPPDQILYQTERYHTGNLGYDIPVERDGWYLLVLKFSEVYFHAPNMKVFDVILNGDLTIATDLDIYERVGRGVAHDEYIEFEVKQGRILYEGEESELTRGQMRVEFIKSYRDNPKVNAIVLMRGRMEDWTPLPPLAVDSDDEEFTEDPLESTSKHRNPSGPKTRDPYENYDTTALLPIFVAIGAFIPLVFCLCKL